jgi:hypothetical protein
MSRFVAPKEIAVRRISKKRLQALSPDKRKLNASGGKQKRVD